MRNAFSIVAFYKCFLYDAVVERLGKESVVLGAQFQGFEQDDTGVTMNHPKDAAMPDLNVSTG